MPLRAGAPPLSLRSLSFLPLSVLLTGCAASLSDSPRLSAEIPAPAPPPAPASVPDGLSAHPPQILDEAGAARLLANKGITLQWIDWNTRGHATVTRTANRWHLRGSQAQAGGPGRLLVEGDIVEIGPGYFTLSGTIRITDTPDQGRFCEKRKLWHFAVTQQRLYYRLREFEWCDGLTDYIDIHL